MMKTKRYRYGMMGFLSLLGFLGIFTEERTFLAFFAFAVDFEYFFLKSDEMLEQYMNRAASSAFYAGMLVGAAATLVNLPVSVCYGIAAAIIPAVSACQSKGLLREAEERTLFALKCTLFLSLPAAAFLLAFPSGVTSFLFSSVTGAEGETLASLVRALALTAVFLSCVQTLAACLTGRGKPKIAAFAMTAAVAFKLVAEFVLLQFPQISVLGAAYAAIGCYFVALAADLLYSIRERKNRIAVLAYFFKFSAMSVAAVFCAAAAARVHVLLALCAAALISRPRRAAACVFRAGTAIHTEEPSCSPSSGWDAVLRTCPAELTMPS